MAGGKSDAVNYHARGCLCLILDMGLGQIELVPEKQFISVQFSVSGKYRLA